MTDLSRGLCRNYATGRPNRKGNLEWKDKEFPKLGKQTRSYTDNKRQSYPAQDRKKQFENTGRDSQYQDGNQQCGSRNQYQSRNQKYKGGNEDYVNRTKKHEDRDHQCGNRNQDWNKDQEYRNRDQQYSPPQKGNQRQEKESSSDDASDDPVTVEVKNEKVKPKRYSSKRQKPDDGEVESKQKETSTAGSG